MATVARMVSKSSTTRAGFLCAPCVTAFSRQIAEQHDVPLIGNPPLARALYAAVDVDQEIPPEHYKAVAEVIGFVMQLKGKSAR